MAYEMRISDGSSDVFSSDLRASYGPGLSLLAWPTLQRVRSTVGCCGVPQFSNQLVNTGVVAGGRLANRHESGHGAARAVHAPPKKDGGGGEMGAHGLADDAVGGDGRDRFSRGQDRKSTRLNSSH